HRQGPASPAVPVEEDHQPQPVMILLVLAYALTDEVHQSFVPGRDCSAADMAADAAGGLFSLLVLSRFGRKGPSPG
ncbi:MAG: VanZ family protein, partial [Candidatus Fermentibacterota bacterium]